MPQQHKSFSPLHIMIILFFGATACETPYLEVFSISAASFPVMDLFYMMPLFQPDRRKQFGALNGQYDSWRRGVSQEDTEQRGPPGRTHVDSRTALSQLTEKTAPGSGTRAAHGVPSLHYLDEDYHRASSSLLAQVANPR